MPIQKVKLIFFYNFSWVGLQIEFYLNTKFE